MRKTFLSLSLGLLSLAASSSATIITAGGTAAPGEGLKTSIGGTTTVTFNGAAGTNPTYTSGAVTYSLLGSGSIRTTSANSCAIPVNDTSDYLCVGPGQGNSVTATFTSKMSYFGFYVASVDTYNSLAFFDKTNSTALFTLTGSEIASRSGISANGNQGVGVFINIFTSNASENFDKIVFTSTSDALESDNHAYGTPTDRPTVDGQVPEPGTLLTIIPAAAFLYFRRKRA